MTGAIGTVILVASDAPLTTNRCSNDWRFRSRSDVDSLVVGRGGDRREGVGAAGGQIVSVRVAARRFQLDNGVHKYTAKLPRVLGGPTKFFVAGDL